MKAIIFAACLLLAGAAQTDAPKPLTEVETLKVQNLDLRRRLIEAELNEYRRDAARMKAELEQARPGWTFDLDAGIFRKADKK